MEGVKFVFPIIRYIIILFTNFSLFFNLSRFQKKNHKRIIVEDCLRKMLEAELQGWAHGVRQPVLPSCAFFSDGGARCGYVGIYALFHFKQL
jgi:hypothetical protein